MTKYAVMVGWLYLANDEVQAATRRLYTTKEDLAKLFNTIGDAKDAMTRPQEERVVDIDTNKTVHPGGANLPPSPSVK